MGFTSWYFRYGEIVITKDELNVKLIFLTLTFFFFNTNLGLLLSIATATVITDLIKITVGRPRPDFIDRCQPLAGAKDAISYGLSTIANCTVQSGAIIVDGFKSFPSGHSSFSFAGLGFLSFFLAGKMGLFDRNGYVMKAWIGLIPLIGASLIAISRVMDYRHRGTDIIAGGLLGFLMAFLSYYLCESFEIFDI